MWEFSARILLAGALIAVAGWTNVPPFDVAWRIGLLTASYGFVAYLIEQKRLINPGFAGLTAGLDALAIAAVLAYAGQLQNMGLLVAAPIVYAVAKRGSNPLATGPIGAAALLGAGMLVSQGAIPSMYTLAHAAGVLVIAMLVNQPRIVVRPKTIQEMITELAETSGAESESGTQALIELREQYRRLSVSYKQLERKSRVDRISAQLLLSRKEPGADFGPIVDKLRNLLEVDGLILYSSRQATESMIVSASSGRVPDDSNGLSFKVEPGDAVFRMKDKAEQAIRAISRERDEEFARTNVVLKHRGLVVGMLTIIVRDETKLESVRKNAEELSDALAQIMMDERMRKKQIRRQKEAELLYEIACRLDGATTETDIAKRTAKALMEVIECDHVAIWTFDQSKPILLAKGGRDISLFSSFDEWLASGAEPIHAYSTAENKWIDHVEATRKRVGSYLAIPIVEGDAAIGMIAVACAPHGSLTPDDAKTVHDVAAEVAHAWTLISSRKESIDINSPRGLLTIAEFQRAVVNVASKEACLVYFEPIQFAELEEEVGKPAIEIAIRQLGLLLRRHAPTNAQICRKAEGSFVVLLPEATFSAAQSWANEIAALAAMRSVDAPNGRASIPLAVKARAADLNERLETRNEMADSSTVTS
jgi:GAF domain-containing protein